MTTTNGNNNGTDRIDLLTEQMAVLTELVTHGFTELKTGLGELRTIAQSQHQEIGRIAATVDKLAETVATQNETVAKQAQTVDRLSLMLERLMSDRVQNN